MKVEVVSKDVGMGENGAKLQVVRKYSITCLKANLRIKRLWIRGSCWGKWIKLKLVNKAWAHKKKPLIINFPSRLLKNTYVEFAFPYALLPHHEGAKWNTIGVIGGICVNLPHCTSPALAYPMENKMPFTLNAICTSCHRMVRMWLYNWRRQRLKWKDPKTSNVETHVQSHVSGVGVKEGIELGWSQGFELDELDV
jgi:hypothetical protein